MALLSCYRYRCSLGSGFKIDFFAKGVHEYDDVELERSRSIRISVDPPRTAMVKSAEDIVLRKLQWFRDGGEVSERQWKDVLGVLATVGLDLDVSFDAIQAGLEAFTGVDRRFQERGEAGGVLVLDDYGHHPTEIRVTLETLRRRAGDRRTVVLFQPHRYSRTHDAFDDFVAVLSSVDVLVLSEVYAAGETPVAGADGRSLSRAIRARGQVRRVWPHRFPAFPPGLVQGDGGIPVLRKAGAIRSEHCRAPLGKRGGDERRQRRVGSHPVRHFGFAQQVLDGGKISKPFCPADRDTPLPRQPAGHLIHIGAQLPAQRQFDLVAVLPGLQARHPALQYRTARDLKVVRQFADALQAPPQTLVRPLTVTRLQTRLRVGKSAGAHSCLWGAPGASSPAPVSSAASAASTASMACSPVWPGCAASAGSCCFSMALTAVSMR